MDLEHLQKQRTQVKSKLTRLSNKINLENDRASHLKLMLSSIKPMLDEYSSIQSQIEYLAKTDVDNAQHESFEKPYFDIVGRLQDAIENKIIASSDNVVQLALPSISLPKFNGTYEEWMTFRDTFESLVHERPNLQNIQKFQFLNSALVGDAQKLVQAIPVANSTYQEAWQLLKTRYEKPRLIVEGHVKALLNLVPCNRNTVRSLLDQILLHTRTLKALEQPTDKWCTILIQILLPKLDRHLREEWQEATNDSSLPSFNDFVQFLTKKANTFESINYCNKQQNDAINQNKQNYTNKRVMLVENSKLASCIVCKSHHAIYHCEKFLKLSVNERIKLIKNKGLCLNCFRDNHFSNKCTSGNCKKCSQKHNTLLHLPKAIDTAETLFENDPCTSNACLHNINKSLTLLSTAVVKIKDSNNQFIKCKVLLDSGSQSNIMTAALASKLKLPTSPVNIQISGINGNTDSISSSVTTVVKSLNTSFHYNVKCLVVPKITDKLPACILDKSSITIPKNIKLADPHFHRPSIIDLLIGAELFYHLLCVGQISNGLQQPAFQKTQFGWIVTGSIVAKNPQLSSCNMSTINDIHDCVKKFWEIEEKPLSKFISKQDLHCENHFQETARRNEQGRFIVKLPFKQPRVNLGDSYPIAHKQFLSLERKLSKSPVKKQQYQAFIEEYLKLNHMKPIAKNDPLDCPTFYLPHHAVINEASQTTKLGVVFNGSAKTSNGTSFNDILSVGPNLQKELILVLLKFRCHKYVLLADITKMYRQILLDESQTPLQRILWRDNVNNPIQAFELLTVTYGTASASYQATRCLRQLADDEEKRFPVGAKIVREDFYVDDLLTGADNLQDAQIIRAQTKALLLKGCFELHKWASNHHSLLDGISSNNADNQIINIEKDCTLKTMGIRKQMFCNILYQRNRVKNA